MRARIGNTTDKPEVIMKDIAKLSYDEPFIEIKTISDDRYIDFGNNKSKDSEKTTK